MEYKNVYNCLHDQYNDCTTMHCNEFDIEFGYGTVTKSKWTRKPDRVIEAFEMEYFGKLLVESEHIYSFDLRGHMSYKENDVGCYKFISVEYLKVRGDLTGVNDFITENIDSLDCSGLRIQKFTDLPDSLTCLTANNCNLQTLEGLPASITHLHISGNLIKDLKGCPPFIESLYCSDCRHLTTLEGCSDTVEELICRSCSLESFDYAPSGLKVVECESNQIKSLRGLPNGIEVIICVSNPLEDLIDCPASVLNLNCADCGLNSLNGISPNVVVLSCFHNNITHIPALYDIETLNRDFGVIMHPITALRIDKKMFTIYSDGQNVHDHTLQESVRNAATFLIQHPSFIGPFEEYMVYNTVETFTGYNLTYCEILRYVMGFVSTPELYNILRDEIIDGKNMCPTGKVSRVINTLSGVYYTIGISNTAQINAICASSYNKQEAIEKLEAAGYHENEYNEFVECFDVDEPGSVEFNPDDYIR